jgi:diadenosine tetraphosphate (Ap4A) HIT family hydrolase
VLRREVVWAVVSDCLVCRELNGEVPLPGGFVYEDEQVAAFHVPPLPELGRPEPYLGHLLVVTRRHTPSLAELNDAESAAVGRAAARLAHALEDAGGAERVFSATVGTGIPHFHLHLLPRYPETPTDVAWHSLDEWDGARRGDPESIAELASRLQASIGT